MLSNKKTTGLRALSCAAALLGLLGAASPAVASTARLTWQGVDYAADPGEANNVTMTVASELVGRDAINIADAGAPITPLWPPFHWNGCEVNPLRAGLVSCALENSDSSVFARLGDLNDQFSMQAGRSTAVDGGPGHDTLVGGSASDTLEGSDGDDLLTGRGGSDVHSGGAGTDTADYSARSAPVSVTLNAAVDWWWRLPDDGQAGEFDSVLTDVENVIGGSGNDTLRGSDGSNTLVGLDGDDTLKGGAGNDYLRGSGGDDTLDGEGAADMAGSDRLDGGSGDDTIYARDGEHDRIDCGSGSDTVWADPIDRLRDCAPEDIQP
jgi:hemolysin type calcium-binding protein